MPNSRIKEAAAKGSRCFAAGFRSQRGTFVPLQEPLWLHRGRSHASSMRTKFIQVAGVANFIPKAKARSDELRNEIKLTPRRSPKIRRIRSSVLGNRPEDYEWGSGLSVQSSLMGSSPY